MKWMKLAAAVAFAFAFGNAYAFHDGGVADCDGCHVMHNASSGASVVTHGAPGVAQRSNTTNAFLLQGSDQSSTCLICHNGPKAAFEDFRVANLTATGPGAAGDGSQTQFNPGGDFGWLQLTQTYHPWDGASTTVQEIGERHGHNIVALDQGLVADAAITVAPGGTYAPGTGIQAFACSSCHDPHGKQRVVAGQGVPGAPVVGAAAGPYSLPIAMSGSYGDLPSAGVYAVGVYRLLGGVNYAPVSNAAFPFPNPSPIAVAPSLGGAAAPFGYNQVEYNGGPTEVRVAYGTGMSEWCQNCHTNIHLDSYVSGAPGLRHPAGHLAHFRQVQADAYNSYVSSGIFTATSQYSSLVPFETGLDGTQIAALRAASSHTGVPGTGDGATTPLFASTAANVMCLSCHRAHASAFGSMTRWNMGYEFLTEGGVVADPLNPVNHGMDTTKRTAAYYGRDVNAGFAVYQRSMCNKCHAKD